MTTSKALHLRDNINRFYVSGKEVGKEFASIEDWVDVTIQGLEDTLKREKKV